MCLIVFAWQPDQPQTLVLAANRDEFHARPSRALGQWPDAKHIYAGRDLQAGGTWLGATAQGRFTALTNIRDPHAPPSLQSRGVLTEGFLRSQLHPRDYLETVLEQREQFSGFNLLVGDRQQLYYLNSAEGVIHRVAPGIYGLSNAALDSPWPKLLSRRQALTELLAKQQADPQALFELMADRRTACDDQLPNTGITLEWERLLSAAFIVSQHYGTRASSALIIGDNGLSLSERSFEPSGQSCGEVHVELLS